MNKKKLFLIAVSAAAIALAVMLAAGAVVLFLNGSARKAENPMEQIYTREQAAGALAAVAPFFVLFAGLSAAGVILGIKDEKQDKPVRDDRLLRDLGSLQSRAVHQTAEPKTLFAGKPESLGWGPYWACLPSSNPASSRRFPARTGPKNRSCETFDCAKRPQPYRRAL